MLKKSLLESLMREALEVATRSKDSETKVGAVLVAKDDGSTIASGYNGFIREAPDHRLPTTRPDKYPYMVHAEQNIFYNCARRGIATNNCIIVITLSPCTTCLRACWQSGIRTIYFLEKYRDFDQSKNMGDLKVNMEEVCTDLGTIYKINLHKGE